VLLLDRLSRTSSILTAAFLPLGRGGVQGAQVGGWTCTPPDRGGPRSVQVVRPEEPGKLLHNFLHNPRSSRSVRRIRLGLTCFPWLECAEPFLAQVPQPILAP
jgi:hypothetical protein